MHDQFWSTLHAFKGHESVWQGMTTLQLGWQTAHWKHLFINLEIDVILLKKAQINKNKVLGWILAMLQKPLKNSSKPGVMHDKLENLFTSKASVMHDWRIGQKSTVVWYPNTTLIVCVTMWTPWDNMLQMQPMLTLSPTTQGPEFGLCQCYFQIVCKIIFSRKVIKTTLAAAKFNILQA